MCRTVRPMSGEFLGYDESDYSVKSSWARLMFISCMATAVIYTVVGLFAMRRLLIKDFRWWLAIVLYFFLGALHAFISLSVLCLAISLVFYTFRGGMSYGEMILYPGIMVIALIFFASGRITILYAM